MRNIKKEYQKFITIYIIANIVVLFYVFLINEFQNVTLSEFSSYVKFLSSLIPISIFGIISLIFSNIISSRIKDIIVFWRVENVLPSHRWYTVLSKYDSRININILKKKYKIHKSPKGQSDLWYDLYSKNKTDERILESQKNYLFSRDITVITFLFVIIGIILYIFGIIYNNGLQNLKWYVVMIGFLYLLFMVVARNNANRFVCNVLAIESCSTDKNINKNTK